MKSNWIVYSIEIEIEFFGSCSATDGFPLNILVVWNDYFSDIVLIGYVGVDFILGEGVLLVVLFCFMPEAFENNNV